MLITENQHNIPQALKKQHYPHFSHFHYYPTVESTNKTALNLLKKNITEGTVIISKTQTHGRGRYQRTWYSPDGGLYITLLFPTKIPPPQLPIFPLLTAVSINSLLRNYKINTNIKWPNDVLVTTKKIAGILLQSTQNFSKQYIICGIGINVNIEINSFPVELIKTATSMLHETGKPTDLNQLAVDLIHTFEETYQSLLDNGSKTVINQWKKNSSTIGKQIVITLQNKTIKGIAENITEDGFLLIKKDDGTIKKILSGDCYYQP